MWGSVSKPVTARIVAGLDERGALRADRPVAEILPEVADTELGRRATTVHDLVEHTSGLPHDLALTDGGLDAPDALTAARRVAGSDDLGERGTFRYSSLGYVLLQAVVERVTGAPFAEAGAATAEAPPGHVPVLTVPRPVPVDVDPAGLGYGYQAGSAERLGEFASAVLRDPPTSRVGEGSRGRSGGWNRELGGEHGPLLRHSGAVPGYFAHVAVAPGRGRAVVVLANRYGEMDASTYARAVDAVVGHRLGGAAPTSPGLPGRYPVVLAVLALTCAAGLVGAVVAARRPRRRSPLARAAAAAVGLTAVGVAAVGPPVLFGAGPAVGLRWAPDVMVLLWAAAAGVALWSLVVAVSRTADGPGSARGGTGAVRRG